jgi:hypothetical protein
MRNVRPGTSNVRGPRARFAALDIALHGRENRDLSKPDRRMKIGNRGFFNFEGPVAWQMISLRTYFYRADGSRFTTFLEMLRFGHRSPSRAKERMSPTSGGKQQSPPLHRSSDYYLQLVPALHAPNPIHTFLCICFIPHATMNQHAHYPDCHGSCTLLGTRYSRLCYYPSPKLGATIAQHCKLLFSEWAL